jgi:uncharacterized membrane protein YdfJ with MMPL/SSD domain
VRTWAGFVLRRPWLVIGAWALLLLAALPTSSLLSDRLSGGGYEVPGSESAAAGDAIVANLDRGVR